MILSCALIHAAVPSPHPDNIQDVDGSCGFIPYYFGYLTRFLFPIYLIKVNPATLEPVRRRNGLCKLARPGDLGLIVGEIRPGLLFTKFLGYTSSEETSKKIIRNILTTGDFAFVSGDLMSLDFYGNLYFKDRIGDTFRWKGLCWHGCSNVGNLVGSDFQARTCPPPKSRR